MQRAAAGQLPTHDPLVDQILLDRYRVVRRIGRGGMGVVYLAEHVLLHKRVAIKTLAADAVGSQEVADRFLREAQAAAAVGHEHVVDVTDMGVLESGRLFFVLEYLEGTDLARKVAAEGPLEVPAVLALLLQLCEALSAVHAAGIVHRDLKPENLFVVRRRGQDFLKVLDFGICGMLEPTRVPCGLTPTGTMLGTPSYMSPEQIKGEKNVDQRADIYAIGAIGQFLLVGKPPFEATSLPGLLVAICNEPPPSTRSWRPEVPEVLDEALLRALSKDPAARFQDCAAFQDALMPLKAVAPTVRGPAQSACLGPAAPQQQACARPDESSITLRPRRRSAPLPPALEPVVLPRRARRRLPWYAAVGTTVFVLLLAVLVARQRQPAATESTTPTIVAPAGPAPNPSPKTVPAAPPKTPTGDAQKRPDPAQPPHVGIAEPADKSDSEVTSQQPTRKFVQPRKRRSERRLGRKSRHRPNRSGTGKAPAGSEPTTDPALASGLPEADLSPPSGNEAKPDQPLQDPLTRPAAPEASPPPPQTPQPAARRPRGVLGVREPRDVFSSD